MEFHLLVVLLICFAKAGRGLKEEATHYDSDQYNVRRDDLSEGILGKESADQDLLPWSDLEELAELEKKAEYTIKVIILTMNRCAARQSIINILKLYSLRRIGLSHWRGC